MSTYITWGLRTAHSHLKVVLSDEHYPQTMASAIVWWNEYFPVFDNQTLANRDIYLLSAQLDLRKMISYGSWLHHLDYDCDLRDLNLRSGENSLFLRWWISLYSVVIFIYHLGYTITVNLILDKLTMLIMKKYSWNSLKKELWKYHISAVTRSFTCVEIPSMLKYKLHLDTL